SPRSRPTRRQSRSSRTSAPTPSSPRRRTSPTSSFFSPKANPFPAPERPRAPFKRTTMSSEIPLFRIGQGYDIHPFKDGRPLILGGVSFESPRGLDGHSDADVLSHAICDALLGAAGLPDIGHYFPNTDPAFKNINSQLLLQKVCAELRARGFEIGNIDASVIAEKPRLIARLGEMKTQLALSM